jgi:hypothetical protein
MKSTVFLILLSVCAHAQGPLIPPPGADPSIGPVNALNAGAPQPTMKSLHQVEPRTPITSGSPGVTLNPNGGFTLTAPGSYYLTGNLSVADGDGIVIAASQVSLDLSGFTISRTVGSAASGSGVALGDGTADVSIKNGCISGGTTYSGASVPYTFSPAGFAYGVSAQFIGEVAQSVRTTTSELRITGCAKLGLRLGGTVERCTVSSCGTGGIEATAVTDSFASENGGRAIAATTVSGSRAERNNGRGVVGFQLVANCYAIGNGQVGINGGTITDSASVLNLEGGISGASVTNSTSIRNTEFGIDCDTVLNCFALETNFSSSGGDGTGINGRIITGSYSNNNDGVGILANEGTVTGCTARSNGFAGIFAEKGSVTNCHASTNGFEGIKADRGSVSHSAVSGNGLAGIASFGGQVADCTGTFNLREGIWAPFGVVSGCKAADNSQWGILANSGSISHCNATTNNSSGGAFGGIYGDDAVISFCFSKNNIGLQYDTGSGATVNSNR